mmetsp:Transcript_27965/g.65240  ORF Transcript_27965/g.65240 Transcript_27965/m.65240 type:complete len:725 (-) Transcript_27965:129-2303(-)
MALLPGSLLALLAALTAGPASAGRLALHARQQPLSPVTRVVQLLKDLYEKTEEEAKTEEELYNKFVCWGKEIIASKGASIDAAIKRLNVLETYLRDLDAGRIELTTERTDLEKEIEQLHADMELAQSMRDMEEKDFLSAKDEMQKAIKALTAAIEVLTKATADHKEGVLLGVRTGFGSLNAEASALSTAVVLGDKFLTKGDALFLKRLLTGEVPTWDWKKLNRPATFKKSYKARSFKIQSVLAKLLETFQTNLDEAEKKESSAWQSFKGLMVSKGAQKTTAQDSLSKLVKENGARGMSRTEASDEVDMLNTQIADDKKYMAQVQKALADKRTEWDARKDLRAAEMQAISKAIMILHHDDARDLFKKSFQSQGYSLLQQGEVSSARGGAATALRKAMYASHDHRLMALAQMASSGYFDEVIAAIDSMVALLKTEEQSDLDKKEKCETDRAADTRSAAKTAREMDDMTDTIVRLEGEIKDLAAEINEDQAQVDWIVAELAKMQEIRDKENADYLSAKKDDEDARALVDAASKVLSGFYKDNGLMLTQSQKQPSQPGEAPPPPPTTWEGPYKGKTEEATGIIAVLDMILEDIDKDLSNALAAENTAVALFTQTTTAMNTDKTNLETQINALTLTKGQKETLVEDTKGLRRTAAGSLSAIVEKIKGAESGCNFFTINFPLRSRNRQIEIDGLLKAKQILSGAHFTEPPDENRELKPFDAFLQHHRQHQ